MGDIFRGQRDMNIEVAVIDSATDQPAGSPKRIKNNKKKSIKQHLLKCYGNFNLISKEVKERDRTPLERLIWFLIFILCFSYCGYLIWKSYTKWSRSPAIVLLTENSESILKIPFPAVTVCPQRKINANNFSFKRYKELYKQNKTYGNFTEQDLHMYEDIDLICDYNTGLKGRKFSLGNETVSNIRKASTMLYDVLLRCYWKGKLKSCKKLFSPVLTEEGICYTFNLIGPEDMFRSENLNTDYGYVSKSNRTRIKGWSPENGYEKNLIKKYPDRSYGAGAKVGLRLTLGEREDGLDMKCMGMVSGFKLLLHSSTSLPRLSQQYIRIPIYEEITVAFTPEKIITSDGLRDFLPERRQCYYTKERALKYFKLYSRPNCDVECLSNFTYARCGCVVFSMPHAPDMEICNTGSLNCTSYAEFELAVWNVNRNISRPGGGNTSIEEASRIADACRCLPTCTEVLYQAEISQLELDHTDRNEYSLDDFILTGNLTRYKVSNVVIFFKRALVDISKRSELYGTADILASCGGLLGLFMGFSVINIIETLYFCILRTYQQGRNPGEEEKEVIQQENNTY